MQLAAIVLASNSVYFRHHGLKQSTLDGEDQVRVPMVSMRSGARFM
jgi:hypothetical protein